MKNVIYFESTSHNIRQFKDGATSFALTRSRMSKTEVCPVNFLTHFPFRQKPYVSGATLARSHRYRCTCQDETWLRKGATGRQAECKRRKVNRNDEGTQDMPPRHNTEYSVLQQMSVAMDVVKCGYAYLINIRSRIDTPHLDRTGLFYLIFFCFVDLASL